MNLELGRCGLCISKVGWLSEVAVYTHRDFAKSSLVEAWAVKSAWAEIEDTTMTGNLRDAQSANRVPNVTVVAYNHICIWFWVVPSMHDNVHYRKVIRQNTSCH